MKSLADALFAAEGTRKKSAKVDALAQAFAAVAGETPTLLPFAARFVAGTVLPTDDARTLGAGGSLVFEAACAASGMSPAELEARARRSGDLGTAVGEAMQARDENDATTNAHTEHDATAHARDEKDATTQARAEHDAASTRDAPGLDLGDAEHLVHTLADTGERAAKVATLRDALARCHPLEARYLVRAIFGELRIGAREGIVEDAIAKAFGHSPVAVRRASGLLADMGELARLAHERRLDDARIVVGRPVGFMLASPIEVARGKDLSAPHVVEDKIDGVRAQVHASADGVAIFARGKGAVTIAYPEITAPLARAVAEGTAPVILDGELVVVTADGRPRPFSAIQPRLKKTAPDAHLLARHPVRYLAYDLLLEGDEPLVDRPFAERRARLERWIRHANVAPHVVLHDSRTLASEEAIDAEFDAARARGFEGLVIKRVDAPYAAGVRGFAWMKVKRAFATLDVVVVAAERGHGRRADVLSDYTFAVWNDGVLETVGKAYSGLTDAEILAMTERLRAIATAEEHRGYLPVRPDIVLEVAFDGLQRGDRHTSGFTMRFARIVRIRDDKRPEEADTIETVKRLWEAQVASGHREEAEASAPIPPRTRGRRSGRRPDVRRSSKQLKLFDD